PFWDEGRSRNVQLAITRDITDRRKTENALRESQERLRAALDASQTGTFYWDIITNQVDWDDALDALFGVTARESARSLSEFVERVHPEDRATVLSACERCAAAGADFDLEFRIIWPDGSVRWLHDRGRTFFSNGKRKYMAGACVDITHRKLGEAQLRAQKQALELIVRGRPLVEILETLTSSMEERLQRRCVASILLLQGERLYPAAGQSVPPEWSEYIRGMKIGAVSGSCGTAAHRKQAVIVTDILNDPLWASFRGEASKHGFRACWSVPILSSDNTVLGTLALYHFQPAAPTSNDIELVEVLARTAAVAIERKRHEELIHSREEALRQSEADFRLLAESMPQMVWTGRSDGYIDYANSKWCEFTGLSLEQTRGTGWAAALHPHDVERSFQTWQAAVATGGMYELEYRFRRASDRSYRWHLGRATPVRDESGKVVKWFGTCTDIHDWKLTQEALRQKDAQFRILTETLPQIVWTAGADGHVDYFNPRWRSLTGLPEVYDDEAWLSVLHPDDRDRCVEHWRLSVRTGEPYEIEYRIFEQASGAYRWHLGRALPLRDESGKVTRWFGSCTDIDDHKRAAEKLEAAVAERTASLRQAINQMEEFSYSVSHDLRAPLRAIEGYSGMIFKKYADGADAELAHCVRRISENSARMQRLINDVLQLSRVGRIEAKLQPFHLKSIISEVIEQNTQFQPPQATVIVGNLHSVIGNDVLLSQVLTNLLGNAVKFVKPGIHPIVRVHSELRGGTVRVWVTDNGIGIPAEYQDKLFGMFERLNQNPSYEGTGIGLVIVRKAVERMGGAVGLDPEAEVGSRFWFELKGA
ncbi:MAG TPA: PAS domain-containing protein, partial [Methylomirabilota bacterium]|nr:PAS domain-containing protein [Methylomirabilota bacterium]